MRDDGRTQLTLRIPRELHQRLVAAADAERRTLNAQVLVYLEHALRQHEATTDRPASHRQGRRSET